MYQQYSSCRSNNHTKTQQDMELGETTPGENQVRGELLLLMESWYPIQRF
uniref:Uncharacterized protein n=1 Tax=Zea mays TaxID=4577 RepID=C0PLQ1_MAIZE|nr:unknown [Zea mays]